MSQINTKIEEQIPRLRRYARALTGDRYRADDLVQDTLERALSKLNLWRQDSDIRAWMFTIMHNLFINQIRQNHNVHAFAPLDDEALEIPVRATQNDGLEMQDLMSAIYKLPDEFRAVVLLVGLEQLRYEEVAQVLDVPVGTVMSRLSRGREKLRILMAGSTSPTLRRVK